MPVHRNLLLCSALLLAAFPVLAEGQTSAPITGTVTDKTTNKPSAGDTVTLIQLKQGMQDSTVATTDARGHYKLAVPDDGIHLVRVTHQKASYFKPAVPGTNTLDIDVYDVAPQLEGVSLGVVEMHIEATETELHVVELLEVLNQSSPKRTQFGPNGFDFYLPADARILRTGATTDGGMPVPASAAPAADAAGNPGHYTFLFPIRPGETQFHVLYSIPYTKSIKFTPRLTTGVHTLAIVLPKSMKLTPGPSSPYGLSPANSEAQIYIAQNVSPSQPLDVTLSGTGTLPQKSEPGNQNGSAQGTGEGQAPTAPEAGGVAGTPDPTKFGGGLGKPLDPDADHDPWSKYKGWILGGLALLLAAAAGVLLRRPPQTAEAVLAAAPPLPQPVSPSTQRHHALKEELYALETDRLQKKISDEEYEEHKRALDLVLLRALRRESPTAEPLPSDPPSQT